MPVRRRTLVGVALVVAVQVLVPAWGLFRESPRFGWQMYSGSPLPPRFVLVDSRGKRTPVESSAFIANRRSEVAYDEHLPPLLCERFPETRYVLARRESPALHARYPCSSA